MGAEAVRRWAGSGRFDLVNIIAPTADDVRDICVEGESGILAICPPSERPRYIMSKRQLIWPNGAKSLLFSADEPERLRGKQHQKLWCDELASWRKDGGAWTQAKLGLRLPPDPQAVITTTPKPRQILRDLKTHPHCTTTSGTTYDNRANLDPAFFGEVIAEYENTHTGRQELMGELLEESEGALWRRVWIDANRVSAPPESLVRVVVGVDPPGGATECGIAVAALRATASPEEPKHYYTLGDYSERSSPARWGAKVCRVAIETGADIIAAEANYGGDMVLATISAAASSSEFTGATVPPVRLVRATRGKAVRAEPWAAKAEQGREHHVGVMPDLEDELCTWEPGMKSPNRLDAKVWALTALAEKPKGRGGRVHSELF